MIDKNAQFYLDEGWYDPTVAEMVWKIEDDQASQIKLADLAKIDIKLEDQPRWTRPEDMMPPFDRDLVIIEKRDIGPHMPYFGFVFPDDDTGEPRWMIYYNDDDPTEVTDVEYWLMLPSLDEK
jgi:hypothetical protein